MSISGVSPGESSSFTEQYLQIVEAWLREFLDKQRQLGQIPKDKNEHQVEITVGGRLVYGRVGDQLVANLTPEIIKQLGQLQSTAVGEKVSGVQDLTFKVDGQVVLQSDREGRVVVNEYFNKDLELVENQSKSKVITSEYSAQDHPFWDEEDLPLEYDEDDSSNNIQQEERLEQEDQVELPIKIAIPPQPSLDQEQESHPTAASVVADSPTIPSDKNANSGIDRVSASLDALPQGELKAYLVAQINEMRQLHQQQLTLQQRQFDDLIQQRLKEPDNPSWWQQAKDTISQVFTAFRERVRTREAAAALKQVFAQNSVPGSSVYHAAGYTITHSGKSYQLNDASGKSLLQFRDTPLGVRLMSDSGQLNRHLQKLPKLALSELPGSLSS